VIGPIRVESDGTRYNRYKYLLCMRKCYAPSSARPTTGIQRGSVDSTAVCDFEQAVINAEEPFLDHM